MTQSVQFYSQKTSQNAEPSEVLVVFRRIPVGFIRKAQEKEEEAWSFFEIQGNLYYNLKNFLGYADLEQCKQDVGQWLEDDRPNLVYLVD